MLKYLFLLIFLSFPAHSDQLVETITTDDLASEWPSVWNNFLDSIMTSHSGTSRPSYAKAGTFWYNTSSKTLNVYDGYADIVVTTFDTTNHYTNPAVGGGTATLASATTTNLGSVSPAFVSITGTTTITSFGSSMLPGQVKILNFASSLLLVHNGTSLILPGGNDITVDSGSSIVVVCLSTGNYRVVSYQPASTSSLPTIARNTGLVNTTGGSATPSATTLTAWIDSAISNTRGTILYRGSSSWSALSPGSEGQVLTSHGASSDPTYTTPSLSGVVSRQIFTSSGTWTKPSGISSNSMSLIECWGAGGAGGTYGGGGGAYVGVFMTTSSISSSVSVTIGTGGTPSANPGGSSSFGSYVTAYGGNGGGSTGNGKGGNAFNTGGGNQNLYFDGGDGNNNGMQSSVYGGGAGYTSSTIPAGVSRIGGNGGSSGQNGNPPGGGGAAGSTYGARGEVRVTVWY